jgi:hypothetical protein
MFEKVTTVEAIEVMKDQTVAVRYLIKITEDSKPFAEQGNNKYIKPGDDYSAEDAKVQAICATVHTLEAVAAYKAAQSAV